VVGDRLERADPVEQLVGGVGGEHRRERGEPVAGPGAAGDAADLLARRRQGGLGGGDVPGGLRGGVLAGAQLLARLVELLGDDLEVVGPLGDEGGGLGGGLRVLGTGGGGDGREGEAAGGDQADHDAGDRTAGRGEGTRHGGGFVLPSTAAYRVS
jgi:hypothetical protein